LHILQQYTPSTKTTGCVDARGLFKLPKYQVHTYTPTHYYDTPCAAARGMRCFLALCCLFVCASAHAVVPVVDILRYAGRWYQVYADLATSTFESNYCVTTDYGLFANGTISVRNRQRDGSVEGAYNGILGWANFNNRTSLGTADGSLSVYLQVPPPAPQGIAAPYDIILLGPATYGPFGLYQYAVVSDPFEVSLFVLARDVDLYYGQFNASVMAQLRADGFINPINEPRMTVQQGCTPYSETDLWTCVPRRSLVPPPPRKCVFPHTS
jgi:lipocalin